MYTLCKLYLLLYINVCIFNILYICTYLCVYAYQDIDIGKLLIKNFLKKEKTIRVTEYGH